tara:strand:- start:340 stop:555 length:216 start_codon:yes stop_codon:yes gene_type:complete
LCTSSFLPPAAICRDNPLEVINLWNFGTVKKQLRSYILGQMPIDGSISRLPHKQSLAWKYVFIYGAKVRGV